MKGQRISTMKKVLLCTILSVVMLLSLAVGVSALGEEMTVAYGTPKIDGTIDDVWAGADRQQLGYCKAGDKKVSSTELPEDCTVYASMLYDDTSLYFLFEITDNEFAFDSTVGDWKNDSIYLYIDEIGDGDPTWTDQQAQIALIPEDGFEMIPRKGATPADYELAYTFPTATTCVMEFKYVVRQLAMKEGTEFTVDFQYNDSIEGAARDYCLGWSDESDDASNNSNCWGFATLGAKGASAAAPASAADVPHGNWVNRDFTASFDDPAWHESASDIDFEDYWADGETNARSGTYYIYLKADGKGDFNVEFEVKDSGYYEFAVCLMAWQKSVPRATDIRIDSSDWIRLEFDYNDEDKELEQFITGLTIWLDKGTHNFTLTLPEGFDDTTLKTLYFDYFFYRFLGESAEIPADAAPASAAPAAPEGYPASGESGNFMMGTVIGNETGWDGTAASGAASAFDGNPATFFDPLGVGDGYCGMQFDEPYILEKVAILSRATFLDRFAGASIEGSNDGEEWETLWESDDVAPSETEYNIVTDFENNYGYTMFRYINWINHGDVAEVEFYGKPGKVDPPAKEEEPAPAEEPKEETPTVEEVVENAAENVTEAVENVAEAAGDAVDNAAEAVSNAVDNAKSGCGSFIGGGLIVLVTVLGSAWIAKRK